MSKSIKKEYDDNLDFELNKAIAETIKELRIKHKLSLEELSKKMNNLVVRQTLSRYELNKSRMTLQIFNAICKALNEEPTEIWNKVLNRMNNNIALTDIQKNNDYNKLSDSQKQIVDNMIKEMLK